MQINRWRKKKSENRVNKDRKRKRDDLAQNQIHSSASRHHFICILYVCFCVIYAEWNACDTSYLSNHNRRARKRKHITKYHKSQTRHRALSLECTTNTNLLGDGLNHYFSAFSRSFSLSVYLDGAMVLANLTREHHTHTHTKVILSA